MSIRTKPSSPTSTNILLILISILIPPIPVFLRTGCSAHLILNLILTLIAWFPGVIHAVWVIWRYQGKRFGDDSWITERRMSDGTRCFRINGGQKREGAGFGAESGCGHQEFREKDSVVYGNEKDSVRSGNLNVDGVRGVDVMGRGNMDGYYGPTVMDEQRVSVPVSAPAYESQEVQKETHVLPQMGEKH